MLQQTLAEVTFEHYRKYTRREQFLNEMNRVVPWPELVAVIAPIYPKAEGRSDFEEGRASLKVLREQVSRGERGDRLFKDEDRGGSGGGDRSDRGDRGARDRRDDSSRERSERQDRDRSGGGDRSDRIDRLDKGDRPDRLEKGDRMDRPDRFAHCRNVPIIPAVGEIADFCLTILFTRNRSKSGSFFPYLIHQTGEGSAPASVAEPCGKVVPIEERLMKGIVMAISGMILLMNSPVYGQSDQQQVTQEDWIERSFDRGPLHPRETDLPDRKQERVDRVEGRAKVDGVLKRKEAARTGTQQKHPSRQILRERPERQGIPHR